MAPVSQELEPPKIPGRFSKKVRGCNCQALADTDGRALVLDPQPANVQDQNGAVPVLRLSRRSFPFITKAFADAGYAGDKPASATIVAIEIVRKPPDQVGFAVHPRRWVVERFFAWISRKRRLWKDPEATLASARAFLYAAAVIILVRRTAAATAPNPRAAGAAAPAGQSKTRPPLISTIPGTGEIRST